MIRNFSLENKTFINAYLQIKDTNGNVSVSCQNIGEVNPETFDIDIKKCHAYRKTKEQGQ